MRRGRSRSTLLALPRRLRPFSVLFAMGASALLMASSAASGSSPLNYAPPFHRVSEVGMHQKTLLGCASVGERPLRFAAATGHVRWFAHATAHSCKKTVSAFGVPSESSASAGVVLTVPIHTHLGSAVPTTVTVTWNLTAGVNATTNRTAACPAVALTLVNGTGSQFCYLGAYATLVADAYLVDRTTGSEYFAANYWGGIYAQQYDYNYTDCVLFACLNLNFSYAGEFGDGNFTSVTFWINASLDHTHRYAVVTELIGTVISEAVGYPVSRASSTLDLQRPGYGADLVGITVT